MNFCQPSTGNWRLTTSHELPATSDKQPATSDALRKDQRAQKNLFMQNKPNFPRFCAKNGYLGEKQTQSNPIQSQSKPIQSQSKPIQTQFKPNQTQFKTGIAKRFHPNNRQSIINRYTLLKRTGDEGNRTLIPAMRPRCAPVTPRPRRAINQSLTRPPKAAVPFYFKNLQSLKTATSHSRRFFLSAHASFLSFHLPDTLLSSVLLRLYRQEYPKLF